MLRWGMDTLKARRAKLCVLLEQARLRAKHEYDNPPAPSQSTRSRHALVAEDPAVIFNQVVSDLMGDPEVLDKRVYARLLKLDKQLFGAPLYHNVAQSLLLVSPWGVAQKIECQGGTYSSVYTWTEWFVQSMKTNEARAPQGRRDLYGKREELVKSISNLLPILSPHLSELPESWKEVIPLDCLAQWDAQKQAEKLNEVVLPVSRSISIPRI